MVERLWVLGAFVTSLAASALLTVLIFHFFRSRSRLAIVFAVLVCGGMFHIISEFSRMVPEFRILAESRHVGDKVLAILGSALTTFGLANVAVELTVQTRARFLRILIVFPALAAAVVCGAGQFGDSFNLKAISYLLECSVGILAALYVILRRKRIAENWVSHLAVIVSVFCLVLIPASIVQVVVKLTGHGFVPAGSLPWAQLILMFSIVGTTLFVSGRWLVRKVRIHRENLNPLAVQQYHLSPRERDIVLEIAGGRSNEEIATMLFISNSTVKNHIYHIYRKIKVHNRVELLNAVMKKA